MEPRGGLLFIAVLFCRERFFPSVVVAQNLSQSKPLLCIKVVMSWKAWKETGCVMVAYGGFARKQSQSLP